MRGRLIRKTWTSDPALYAPPKYRRACSYHVFIPDPLSESDWPLPGEVAGVVSDAQGAIAELNAKAGPELRPLARLLLRTESIASSKVEGMQMDARTLARAEARQETGASIGSEAAEILANVDAMQLAIEQASLPKGIDLESLLEIHGLLLARDSRTTPGQLRVRQNWIGGNDYNPCGADFVPPPPDDLGPLVDDLIRFCNEETLPPLVQAAIAHAQFETIHPFEDGNGRTGRALVQVILRRRGLAPAFVPPISVILAQEKDRYIGGLTNFRDNKVPEWLEAFGVATANAAHLAAEYTDRVTELQRQWRQRLKEGRNPRTDAVAWTIIELLPGHPVITVPVAVAVTERTKPAVTKAFDDLQAAGVLIPLSTSKRNRSWEADGLLDLIVHMETGEA